MFIALASCNHTMHARPFPKVQMIPPGALRFTQKAVASRTSDGLPLEELEQSMKKGWQGDPVDAVQWSDGSFTSVDNRRVLSAQRPALAAIPVRIHGENEPIPAGNAVQSVLQFCHIRQLDDGTLTAGGTEGTIQYAKGTVARTWGEAALFRAASQGHANGQRFPLQGSYAQPQAHSIGVEVPSAPA